MRAIKGDTGSLDYSSRGFDWGFRDVFVRSYNATPPNVQPPKV